MAKPKFAKIQPSSGLIKFELVTPSQRNLSWSNEVTIPTVGASLENFIDFQQIPTQPSSFWGKQSTEIKALWICHPPSVPNHSGRQTLNLLE